MKRNFNYFCGVRTISLSAKFKMMNKMLNMWAWRSFSVETVKPAL
jgi:hypothetical protein